MNIVPPHIAQLYLVYALAVAAELAAASQGSMDVDGLPME